MQSNDAISGGEGPLEPRPNTLARAARAQVALNAALKKLAKSAGPKSYEQKLEDVADTVAEASELDRPAPAEIVQDDSFINDFAFPGQEEPGPGPIVEPEVKPEPSESQEPASFVARLAKKFEDLKNDE